MKPYKIIIFLFAIALLGSCSKNDGFTDSIFIDTEEFNPDSPTYSFDLWLHENYLKPYNLAFKYRMEDVGSDMFYNLVPASIEKSKQLAQLTKFLWFDVYAEMVDEEFLKKYGPRIIHLIGSPAYSPNTGTILLGTAEGGIKITLFNCNNLDHRNVNMMNEYFFKTMHHEFAHILHQNKMYPKEYEQISAGDYSPLGWQYLSVAEAARLGFVSQYSACEGQEDFVEKIANYLLTSDTDWNNTLDMAGEEGREKIFRKLEICSNWMKEKWGIDLDIMRAEINRRQLLINDDFFDPNI